MRPYLGTSRARSRISPSGIPAGSVPNGTPGPPGAASPVPSREAQKLSATAAGACRTSSAACSVRVIWPASRRAA